MNQTPKDKTITGNK